MLLTVDGDAFISFSTALLCHIGPYYQGVKNIVQLKKNI